MYGMINRAIEGYYTDTYGPTLWEQVRHNSKCGREEFVTLEQYPDEVSVGLIVAGAKLLNKEPGEVLIEVGEYFIQFTMNNGYKQFLTGGGSSIPEMLGNLDNMHTRIALSFPHLNAPSFWCTDVCDDSLILHYRSDREGFSPLVIGLVKGLGKLHGFTVAVEHLGPDKQDGNHQIFKVDYAQ